MKTKVEAVDEIGGLLDALFDKFDDGIDQERDYMVEHSPARLEAAIRDMPTAGAHLLAAIGDSDADGGVSVVGLAARSGHLKGTVSKYVQRMVDAGFVERCPVPGNRKEIRLRLTPDGQMLERVHRRMHVEMRDGLREFLLRYTATELQTVTKVLDDLLRVDKRGVRLVTGMGR